jgi:hypothetical protein
MEYKAISLHQPWASLIALEIKKRETRSWSTKYRGKLLICSTKKKYVPNSELINKIFDLTDIGAFDRRRLDFLGVNTTYTEYLPLGKVLCLTLCALKRRRFYRGVQSMSLSYPSFRHCLNIGFLP